MLLYQLSTFTTPGSEYKLKIIKKNCYDDCSLSQREAFSGMYCLCHWTFF